MMQDSQNPEDDLWVIWNGSLGVVDTVNIGIVETDSGKRSVWLDEPYDMVGPLDLDELIRVGKIAFAACTIMSRQKWQDDQVELRLESHRKRRAEQERINERFGRHNRRYNPNSFHDHRQNEKQHRQSLNLPLEGTLEVTQIKIAYRRLARKAHPDVGGTHEQFIRIKQARDALIAIIS